MTDTMLQGWSSRVGNSGGPGACCSPCVYVGNSGGPQGLGSPWRFTPCGDNSGGARGLGSPWCFTPCGDNLGGPRTWAHLGVLPHVGITLGAPGACRSPCVYVTLGARAHLGVQHVNAEVAESSLEKVVLGAILEEWAVHGVGPHLQAQGGGQPEGWITARHLGDSWELGPCPVTPCEPRTLRARKPETSPGKVCVWSERPRTGACRGWACGPRAEASCPWAPRGTRPGDGGGGPAVRLTGGWHASGQRGGRLQNMRGGARPTLLRGHLPACLPARLSPPGGRAPPRREHAFPGDAPSCPLCRLLSCYQPSRASGFFPLSPHLGVGLALPGRPW